MVERHNSNKKRKVVIVGGGGTGVAAAAAAIEVGNIELVVLEKNPMCGGVTSMATGAIRACGTRLQKELGLRGVSKAYAYKEFTTGDPKNIIKPMLDTFLDNSAPAIEWLIHLGCDIRVKDKFILWVFTEDQNQTGGDRMVQVLYQYARQKGAEFYFNVRANGLVISGEKVAGVKALTIEGKSLEVTADAVILADGGFWGAPKGAFIDDLTPTLCNMALEVKGSWKMGGVGDAARMAKEIGADLRHMDFLNYTPHRYLNNNGELSEDPGSASPWAFGGAISLDQSVTRFINEDLNELKELYADEIMKHLSKRGEKWFWIVWDGQGVANAYRIRQWIEAGFVDDGFILVGQTITELAQKMGVTSTNLENAINKYNNYFNKGLKKDTEFGRNLEREYAIPLRRPPFYAMRSGIAVNNRKGGIATDTETRVLRKDGSFIEGLYAAGSTMDTVSFFGNQWIAGIGETACAVWGRIAGDNAARGTIGASTRWLTR